jgi:hypothetical protein
VEEEGLVQRMQCATLEQVLVMVMVMIHDQVLDHVYHDFRLS